MACEAKIDDFTLTMDQPALVRLPLLLFSALRPDQGVKLCLYSWPDAEWHSYDAAGIAREFIAPTHWKIPMECAELTRPAQAALSEEGERYKQSNIILNREYNRLGDCCDLYRKMLYEYGIACQTVVTMARKEGLGGTTSAQYWISQHTFDMVRNAIKVVDDLTKQVTSQNRGGR